MKVLTRTRPGTIRRVTSAIVMMAIPLVAAPAMAQQSCHSICAPTLLFHPGVIWSHIFGGPRVTDLATGVTHRLQSHTNLQLQFIASAPTAIPRTHLNLTVQWLPNARATTNPFTEYTSSDESSPIHATTASVGLNASVDALTPKETGGWIGMSGYVGDLFSPAARPGDNSDYTHKLDLGLIGTVNVFDWLPKDTWAHDAVSAYAILDYVATGLPRVGDVVPKGVRRFDTAARPAALIAGVSIRLAPLTTPPGS